MIGENILNPDLKVVATNAVAFVATVLILKRFVWGRLIGYLDARRKRIQDSLDEIEIQRTDLEARESDYRNRMEKAGEDARALRQAEIEEGRRIAGEYMERARRETEEKLETARQTIQIAKLMAEASFREDLVRMSMSAAEKVIGSCMDSDLDRRLVEQAIAEISESHQVD